MSCMASQLSGDLPIAFDRRKAISGLTELRSRTTRAKVEAATPIFSANDLILMSNGSIYVTRINSPGCGGLCIRPMTPDLLVIVLIVNENDMLALIRKTSISSFRSPKPTNDLSGRPSIDGDSSPAHSCPGAAGRHPIDVIDAPASRRAPPECLTWSLLGKKGQRLCDSTLDTAVASRVTIPASNDQTEASGTTADRSSSWLRSWVNSTMC